jgi:hypothetical protein
MNHCPDSVKEVPKKTNKAVVPHSHGLAFQEVAREEVLGIT